MHELALSQSILDIVLSEAERHSAQRVKSIKLLIGELSNVDSDALSFGFEVVSRGTKAEGALLECELVRAALKCSSCDTVWTPGDSFFGCPKCGESGELLKGKELQVDSLEVE